MNAILLTLVRIALARAGLDLTAGQIQLAASTVQALLEEAGKLDPGKMLAWLNDLNAQYADRWEEKVPPGPTYHQEDRPWEDLPPSGGA